MYLFKSVLCSESLSKESAFYCFFRFLPIWLYSNFYIQDAGTNYTAAPVIAIENTGDIQATGTAVLTAAGDQVASITITNGGYGIPQTIDGSYNLHPTVTFTNAAGDTTGSGAVGYAIMRGEKVSGNNGAQYRIKSIEYLSTVRSK